MATASGNWAYNKRSNILLESQMERRRMCSQKSIQRNSGWKKHTQIWQKAYIYRFKKLSKLQTGKLLEILSKTQQNQTPENQKQTKILTAERKMTPTQKRKKFNDNRFLIGNHGGQKWQDAFELLKEKNCQLRILD